MPKTLNATFARNAGSGAHSWNSTVSRSSTEICFIVPVYGATPHGASPDSGYTMASYGASEAAACDAGADTGGADAAALVLGLGDAGLPQAPTTSTMLAKSPRRGCNPRLRCCMDSSSYTLRRSLGALIVPSDLGAGEGSGARRIDNMMMTRRNVKRHSSVRVGESPEPPGNRRMTVACYRRSVQTDAMPTSGQDGAARWEEIGTRWRGRVPYREAWALQKQLAARRADGAT